MGETETDQQLVERVQRGDSRAFVLLVRKYQHKIVSVIGRYVSDWSEAQDVSQEAFLRAYRAIQAFRGDVDRQPTISRSMMRSSTRAHCACARWQRPNAN